MSLAESDEASELKALLAQLMYEFTQDLSGPLTIKEVNNISRLFKNWADESTMNCEDNEDASFCWLLYIYARLICN